MKSKWKRSNPLWANLCVGNLLRT